MGYVGQKVVNDIRDELYAHIQTLSFSYFTRTPTGRDHVPHHQRREPGAGRSDPGAVQPGAGCL